MSQTDDSHDPDTQGEQTDANMQDISERAARQLLMKKIEDDADVSSTSSSSPLRRVHSHI